MTAGEGVEAFRRVLAVDDLRQVVVSTGSLDARIAVWSLPEVSAEPEAEDQAVGAAGGYERPDIDQEYVAPRNNAERDIARIWGELLGIDRVGIHDEFLDLGGHSLMATRMLARLRSELKLDLTLEDVFTDMTVARVAARVSAGTADASTSAVPVATDAAQDLLASIYSAGNRVKSS
jgi:acyl carrier protein